MNINEIKKYLSENEINIDKLDSCTEIKDIKAFIDTHISFLEFNKGNKTFKPYYNRLIKLIEINMIGKFLKTGAKSFDEILAHMSKFHNKESLKIELQTLLNIGKIIFENDKYRLK